MSENGGVRSECKKFEENSRQMAPVSTICDEYCSFTEAFFNPCIAFSEPARKKRVLNKILYGRHRPEVQPLFFLYTIFDRKRTLFNLHTYY